MLQKAIALCFALGLMVAAPTFAQPCCPGAVYAMTNAAGGNEIVVYDRADDGTLTLNGTEATGGQGGIGEPPEPEDALGSASPLILSKNQKWLFAVNAGSDEISVFRVRRDGLTLVDLVDSGGPFPVSLTLHRKLLYVLNSGGDGNITGFTVNGKGRLTPLAGSTRSLDAGGTNPPFFLESPAQVGFDRRGKVLVVTVKGQVVNGIGSNEIRVYPVDRDGLPSADPVTTISHGNIPFGFTFDRRNHLLVAEAFGNGLVGDPNASAVSSYDIAPDGTLELISASVENFQTATCWIARSSGRYAYTTNNGSDTITGYRVGRDGALRLLNADGVTGATGVAPVDLAMTKNGRFLYNVNAGSGTVSMFRVSKRDGSLRAMGEIGGLPVNDGAVGIAAR